MYYNLLIFNIILTFVTSLTGAHVGCQACINLKAKMMQCRTSSNVEPVRKNESYQHLGHQCNSLKLYTLNENTSCRVSLQNFEEESLQKVQELQKDPAFQETVKALQNNSSQLKNTAVNSVPETQDNLFDANLFDTSLYIFVSFSLSEKALLNLACEAKQFGATLVLKGFKEGSYRKTAQALQEIIIKTGQGVIIDPELYTLFNITAVPTFVLAKPFQLPSGERIQTPIKWAPIHDKVQGHVSAQYALETFAKEGDLKDEAQALLKRGSFKEEGATK